MEFTASEQLAFELTSCINNRLLDSTGGVEFSPSARSLLGDVAISPHIVGCAWAAFHRVQGGGRLEELDTSELLCTVPADVRLAPEFRAMCDRSGLWAGSLFEAICGVFNAATSTLVVMVPYWSTAGVDGFLRHLSRRSLHALDVTIFTQNRETLDRMEMLTGCHLFVDGLQDRGARCTLLHPQSSHGNSPLVHAKVAVADRRIAYLGSANFTAGGTDLNYETGLIVRGRQAEQLATWLAGLREFFVAFVPNETQGD